MAWTIKDNRKKYQMICPECKSIIGFTDNDKEYYYDEVFGYQYASTDIQCPACKSKITLSIDGEKQADYKSLD